MGKVIGILSLKGGVGKTTVSTSLAAELVHGFGKKVLLIDANYSAPNVGIHMRTHHSEHMLHEALSGDILHEAIQHRFGVDVIPGNFLYRRDLHPERLKAKIGQLKNLYDFIVVDSSPSLNEEFFSSFFAVDELFVVSTPDYPSLSGTIKLAKLAKQRNRPVRGILLNRSVDPSWEVSVHEIQDSTGIPVVSVLREDESVRAALHAQGPVTVLDKHSPFSREIRRFAASLTGMQEKHSILKQFLFKDLHAHEVNREMMRQHFYTSIFEERARQDGIKV